jgi:hypothetical protein
MGCAGMTDIPTCAIFIPTQGSIRTELMMAMISWAQSDAWNMILAASDTKPTTDNRNRICAEFLKMERQPDVLMTVDADVFPRRCPAPLVRQMMEPDSPYDVIGLVCPTWRPDLSAANPIRWAVHNLDGENLVPANLNTGDALVEVDLIGSGAILMRRNVLEDPHMRAPFMDVFSGQGFRKRGHDYHFCYRAKRLGYRIWAAPAHICGHSRQIELLDVVRMQQLWEAERERYERVLEAPRMAEMPEWAAS